MINENMEKIVFLALVTDRKQQDAILTALLDTDIHLLNTIYGKSTVNAGTLQTAFGLVPEKNRAFIVCVTTERKARIALNMLVDKFNFDKPNTGIAFTIPVDWLSF